MAKKKKTQDPAAEAPVQENIAMTPTPPEEKPIDTAPEPVETETVIAAVVPTEPEEEGEPELEVVEVPAGPAPKLERLQKILAAAGIASRRHAEELITQGRVQVNGQIVTQLGSKADPAHDHIRVDGKLLHGPERLRYFVLNKPKGYVTTVSDPEGRPTVMEFFARMGERLYPVGRLDYLSEGLLLMTNDGELANGLTKAAAGVKKTYLVKVAGQPADEELDRLREGVSIERGKLGEGKVRTAPARIRQVREGDNPWFEVALIEGRNRELRKMFEEIGHHVEKIRRVGYGPLVLDVEPGKLRELDSGEVEALRLTAAGKLKPNRLKTKRMLPKDAGKPVAYDEKKPQERKSSRPAARVGRETQTRRGTGFGKREDRPARRFDHREGGFGKRGGGFEKPFRQRDREERAPDEGRGFAPRGEESRPRRGGNPRFGRPEGGRTGNRRDDRGFQPEENARTPFRPRPERRPFDHDESAAPRRFGSGSGAGRPQGKSFGARPGKSSPRPGGFAKPAGRGTPGAKTGFGSGTGRPQGKSFEARPGKSSPRTGGFAKPAGRGKPGGKTGFGGRSKPVFGGKKTTRGGFKSKPRPGGKRGK